MITWHIASTTVIRNSGTGVVVAGSNLYSRQDGLRVVEKAPWLHFHNSRRWLYTWDVLRALGTLHVVRQPAYEPLGTPGNDWENW